MLGQVRRVTAAIRRKMRRRAAIEPVIGHLKAGHRMGRNYLKGREGDRIMDRIMVRQAHHEGRGRRRRLQLLPAPALARSALACPNHDAHQHRLARSTSLKITQAGFFTNDLLVPSARPISPNEMVA